jgi:hypothetical protein
VRWLLWAAAAWTLLGIAGNMAVLMGLASRPDKVIKAPSRARVARTALVSILFGGAYLALFVIAGLHQ